MSVRAQIILFLFGTLNLASFLAYLIDKLRAGKNVRRIPENRLLLFSFLGPFGSIPGIWWLRHKTRKASYLRKYILILAASLSVHWLLASKFWT